MSQKSKDKIGLAHLGLSLLYIVSAGLFFAGIASVIYRRTAPAPTQSAKPVQPPKPPPEPRTLPDRFPRDTHLPPLRESLVCGVADPAAFRPELELVVVHDGRIWWESDRQTSGTENDHIVHRNMEKPLRELATYVQQAGGRLKVHDAYRPSGLHNTRSLHKEGRAVDLTADGITLEELAKFCWISNFDWVYYEYKKGRGAHIHCSVIRSTEP